MFKFPYLLLVASILLFGISRSFSQETFVDTFSTVSYGNNEGTLNFNGDWQEFNENFTSPTEGQIQINGSRLRLNQVTGQFILRNLNLNNATSATVTFAFDGSLIGNEALSFFMRRNDGSLLILQSYNASNSGAITVNVPADYIHANSAIGFFGNGWEPGEIAFVDDVQVAANFNPFIVINDITVNENQGTATFTARHAGAAVSGSFTVNYTTNDGAAIAGDDYTTVTGTLNFNGTNGDTEDITVPIIDNTNPDGDKDFTISLTSTSNTSVDITDTATGTIDDDEVILDDVPLTLFQQFNGYFDYAITGGSFRTADNDTDACSIATSSSTSGLTTAVPPAASIERAYLIWSHSNAIPDINVTFQGQNVVANQVTSFLFTNNRNFYGMVADVTSIIQTVSNLNTETYTVTDLTIDNSNTYCISETVLGGWSLVVFYEEPSLPAVTINFYNGFDGGNNVTSSFTLSGFYAIGSVGSKTTSISWEGDETLANNENLQFITASSGNNILSGDGGQTGTNPFNSTLYDNVAVPEVNNANLYGVDIDTYNVSSFIQQGESSATTQVQVGQDLVIMNSVLLKVPSNLISGTVFEDMNYGGGNGRNLATSSGVPVEGAVVELYDSLGILFDTQVTDANGVYTFGSMANGDYSVRVVNSSVQSNRPGGTSCSNCLPVQTYRTNFSASTLTEVTTEVGGANPAGTDIVAGVLIGAQTVANMTINNEGAIGIDFGFNFNTIVNTNEDGQGSLEQFILNSNNLGETGLDIVANSIFDPIAGDDTSIFMIPSASDPLGRTSDVNFSSGVFDISISNGNPLTPITGTNTIIDGRTQTAYSGDSNSGTVGVDGRLVGVSLTPLPNFERPEIQIHRNNGDVLRPRGTNIVIRNVALFADRNAGVLFENGTLSVLNSLIGTNANGVNAGGIAYGVEIATSNAGTIVIEGNYIATNTIVGVFVNGGNASKNIRYNHIFANGDSPCDKNIDIQNGSDGVNISYNLIENSSSDGIGVTGPGPVIIDENSITGSGQNGGNCSGAVSNAGINLSSSNATISNNQIFENGGSGIIIRNSSSIGNTITQNSIFNNGTTSPALGIDLTSSGNIGDGVTINDSGDTDSGPNGFLNFPIISTAYVSGNTLVVKGWSRPGTNLEFFLTDINQGTAITGDNQLGLSVDYGEGQTFIGSAIEGDADDGDTTSSNYNDVDGNSDNTNRFEFALPLPSGTSLGNMITATATLSGSTSEFSPMSILKVATVITNRRVTYRVNKD